MLKTSVSVKHIQISYISSKHYKLWAGFQQWFIVENNCSPQYYTIRFDKKSPWHNNNATIHIQFGPNNTYLLCMQAPWAQTILKPNAYLINFFHNFWHLQKWEEKHTQLDHYHG